MKELAHTHIWGEEDDFGPISLLSITSSGKLAIGGSAVYVYDLANPATTEEDPLYRFPCSFLPDLAWSPDGKRLAICQGQDVAVYDAVSGELQGKHTHKGAAKNVTWSPDGKRLASCSEYGQYHCWQLEAEKTEQVRFTLTPPFLLWLPDGRIATNPFMDRSASFCPNASSWQVQIWDVEQNAVEFLLDDHTRQCDKYITAAASPGGSLLALGTENGIVQIWSLRDTPRLQQEYRFHTAAISGLAWGSGGTSLATCSRDGHIAVWDVWGALRYHAGWRGDHTVARGIAWWRDTLVTASDDGQLAFYYISQEE